jgi:23S rRNA pseudouridine1911/1915/1917 synthase
MEELKILFEDREILVAVKPEGVDSEAARGFGKDMVNMIRNHLAQGRENTQPPYVGVIRRLDKPVSGIMVFAKTKEAAAALSKELRDGKMTKTYRAILCGQPAEKSGELCDWMVQEKKGNLSRVGKKTDPGAKEAKLSYTVLRKQFLEGQQISEVEIRLLTGRHHQIRVQFASRGMPLMGDRKYNPAYQTSPPAGLCGTSEMGKHLCLTAVSLSFTHPKTRKPMHFSIDPPFSL